MKCTKIEMMDKAIHLFKQNGYDETTVNQICEACNVTKGSFYNYYKSKREILLDYYNTKLSNYPEIMALLVKTNSYKEQLWRVLEYSIDVTIELGAKLLYHILLADMEQGSKLFNAEMTQLREVSPKYEELVRELIRSGQETGEIKSACSPDLLWYTYVNGLFGVAMSWSSSGGTFDEKEALRVLFDVVFA